MNLWSQIKPQKFSKFLAQGGFLSRNKLHFPPSQLISLRSNSAKKMERTFFRFAGIQMMVDENKEYNLEKARHMIGLAKQAGAHVVCLPECFNCPYSIDAFRPFAENIPEGPSTLMLQELANDLSIYIIGGSYPELELTQKGDRCYNTSVVFSPDGTIIAKHRKVHMFDINIPGKISFQESKTLSPGNQITIIETAFGRMGLAICYDIRFPEVAQICMQYGCKVMIYPGAFNMTTGPAHWELLLRSRAVDNQMFVAAISPARNPNSVYQAWGHSTIVNPWGDVIATTDHDEAIIYADIDLKQVEEVRAQLPILKQKRSDMYTLKQTFAWT